MTPKLIFASVATSTMMLLLLGCSDDSGTMQAAQSQQKAPCQEAIPQWWRNSSFNDGQDLSFYHLANYFTEFREAEQNLCLDPGADLNQLLSSGLSVDAADASGRTALMQALIFHEGQQPTQFIDWLLNNGAAVNQADNNGVTALYFSPNGVITELLINHNAEVKHRDANGRTPFMARLAGNGITEEETQLLLSQGAEVNAKDKYGLTPLLYLTSQSSTAVSPKSIVGVLVQNGADIATTDEQGATALMRATYAVEFSALAEALIEAGIDVNATDNNGRTVLFYIVTKFGDFYQRNSDIAPGDSRNLRPILDLLKQADLDFNIADDDGYTAINYALKADNTNIASLLEEYGATP
ncbi:ankyrin repeat domain-containing protein [Halioxenophilus aromaticivorans]|uniref:Ankyrin repeat domain-containing protein n=1 Tax=Halioxenophilus aromaticivorans TaxID=1306992 RepID=A0AAV3U2Y3_9ALTE